MNPSIPNDPFIPSFTDPAPGGQLVEESPPFLEYAQLLWYRKWTVTAITLLVGIAGWVWANQQTPVYRAQSSMMIGTSSMTAISPDMAWYARKLAPDEIQVYTEEMNDPGEFGLELHVNYALKGAKEASYEGEKPGRNMLQATPEFSYGVRPRGGPRWPRR